MSRLTEESGLSSGTLSEDTAPTDVARQNLADQDQTQADVDQTLADRDQTVAERDQLASDADQVAADRDLLQHKATEPTDYPDYHLSRVQRLSSTAVRHAAKGERTSTANGRELTSERRDENATARDRIAHEQDLEEIRAQANAVVDTEVAKEALRQLSILRTEAAADRDEAASDRARAATKRKLTAEKRAEANARFRMANRSQIGGVLYHGAGDLALEGEFLKARESETELLLVGLALDGLSNGDGERMRDGNNAALKEATDAIRSRLPDGTPIVAAGPSDFVFTVRGVDPEEVLRKFTEVDPMIALDHFHLRVAIGQVRMEPDDTFPILMERALSALQEARVNLYGSPPADGDGA